MWQQLLGTPIEEPVAGCAIPHVPEPVDIVLPSDGQYSTVCEGVVDGDCDVAVARARNHDGAIHLEWSVFDASGHRIGALPEDASPGATRAGFVSATNVDWQALRVDFLAPSGALVSSARLPPAFIAGRRYEFDPGVAVFAFLFDAGRTVLTAGRVEPGGGVLPPVGIVSLPGVVNLSLGPLMPDGNGHFFLSLRADGRTASAIHGVWLEPNGNPLMLPFAIDAPPAAALPDGAIATKDATTWREIIRPLATTPEPAPQFLRLRPGSRVAVTGSGELALLQPTESYPSLVRPLEIRRADGAVCGSVELPLGDGFDSGSNVGRDGSLLETRQSCDGTSCRCRFRWWPRLLE